MLATAAARCSATRSRICSPSPATHVTREYYINDAGAQVDVLARSVFLRYREALGEGVTIPDGLYPGTYLKAVGEQIATEYGPPLKSKPENEWLPVVRAKAVATMMDGIRDDLAALNIHFDVFFSERSLIDGELDEVSATIESLRKSGEVYEGRLPPPKSGNLEDWEDREQTLFKSTDFGDDVDRPSRNRMAVTLTSRQTLPIIARRWPADS